jgi:hypothetical protein
MMVNLIQNSNWQQASQAGGPLHFSSTGPITFDTFIFSGNRTCSVSMPSGQANDTYDAFIPVRGRHAIEFGYVIRAVEAESVALRADFLDAKDAVVQSYNVQVKAPCSFSYRSARFLVPLGAEVVRLSLAFEGKITACTFCAPFARYA